MCFLIVNLRPCRCVFIWEVPTCVLNMSIYMYIHVCTPGQGFIQKNFVGGEFEAACRKVLGGSSKLAFGNIIVPN